MLNHSFDFGSLMHVMISAVTGMGVGFLAYFFLSDIDQYTARAQSIDDCDYTLASQQAGHSCNLDQLSVPPRLWELDCSNRTISYDIVMWTL